MINKKSVSRIQKGKGNYVFIHYNDGRVGIVGLGGHSKVGNRDLSGMKEYMTESVDPERRMMMEKQINDDQDQEPVEDLPEKIERLKNEIED
jgi:hypothetical protein